VTSFEIELSVTTSIGSTADISSFLNPSIVAAIISAVVSFMILGMDKLFLAPKARRESYELAELEKRISAYRQLIALLRLSASQAAAIKGTQLPRDKPLYYLEKNDVEAVDLLFRTYARLLSQEIAEKWFKAIRDDASLATLRIGEQQSDRSVVGRSVICDLNEVYKMADLELKELVTRWQALARIKPP